MTVALISIAFPAPARAVLWDGGGVNSEWIEPANWQFNMLPSAGDTATILNDTATITGGGVPPVMAVELGSGATSGGLIMTGGVNLSALNVGTSVAVASAGTLTLGGGGPATSQITAASLITGGTVSVLSRGTVNLTGQLTQTGGTVSLSGGTINAATVSMQAGLLNGIGDINANVTIGNGSGPVATLAPGTSLGIDGNLKLAADARLEVQFRPGLGGGFFERIDVTGTATLGGVLDLSILGGATPIEGATYTIINAEGFNGVFDDIVGLPTGDGSWGVHFDDFKSTINVQHTGILGNMNLIGGVDEDDVEMFAWAIRDANTYNERFILPLEVMAAGAFMADMDGDDRNTFADIPEFLEQVALSGGSPLAAMATMQRVFQTVPEPCAGSLASGFAMIVIHWARRARKTRGRST